ncbi:MAG: NUDIX hydrolase [Thermodesulfobacteriota bacterium]
MVHRNPWFNVVQRGDYFTIEENRLQAAVLPIVADKSILLVKVKRPILADSTIELPAGGAKNGETPVQTAARELHEETGVLVEDLSRFKRLRPFSVSPRHAILGHIFQINLSQQEYDQRGPSDGEVDEIECLAFAKVKEKIVCGEIYQATSVAVLSRFLFAHDIGC